MQIEEQKDLAQTILDCLKPHGFDVVLAGGAVRDWYRGKEANDLDFFIAGEPRPDAIQQILDVKLSSLAEKTYEDSLFEGFTVDIGGQECQFLFHRCDNIKSHVEDNLPVSCSECWYDGEEYWYSNLFKVGEDHQVLIFNDEKINNWKYVDKMHDAHLSWGTYGSVHNFLRQKGKPPRATSFADIDILQADIGILEV